MFETTDKILEKQWQFFRSHATLDIGFRINQLKRLRQTIRNREGEILDALHFDLGKSEFEAFSSEVGMVLNELSLHIRKLRKWARPRKVKTPVIAFPSASYIHKQPYGRVLVVSPFNFPFMLAMIPVIGAVSGGNVVVLKPSEYTSKTAAIIEKILSETFRREHVCTVQGGIDVSQHLLAQRWDKIFFTGSSRVGKIVLEAAAKHLTPVVLELGGKNPVVVDKDANLKIAARRIAWGKLLNAGQTCVAPDYLFVHEEVKEKFLELLKTKIEKFVTEHPHLSDDFPSIVNEGAIERLKRLLDGVTVYYGGRYDSESKHFAPTLLTDVSPESEVMKDEIFGPILPVMTFTDLDRVVEFINRGEKPLALYYFSEDKKKQKAFLSKTYSGDAAINEVVMHFTNLSLPFGGVGYSGMGSYHGKRSFEVFSHERSVMKTTTNLDLPLRYPPYKKSVLKLLRTLFR